MAYAPSDPYDYRMAAVRSVTDRLAATVAFVTLRDRIRELYPTCTRLRAWTRQAEHGLWVFTEVHAFDEHGAIIAEPRFADHVIDTGRLEFSPDTARHYSDADTIRALGQLAPDGAHHLDITEEPRLAIFDLLDALPVGARLDIAHRAAPYAGGTFVSDREDTRRE